ncbi:3-hydroxyacyl-CoA dehydrogenase NAD-binding domain-containing protein [Chitinophaga rhizosphaerae]|uniref:3-hydroxyacyl-CoA dehydrogenase NAD-binding domain-containing protein n=1 Tax=Chitinophaga rhizosphaerae TaxID=1864947 RepID=UPI000F80DF72|nr:3-hydroxyacyl-CoA dehydrogenase NAD-binding domain-containing protein [Chitinophaga rhizosphaerae]
MLQVSDIRQIAVCGAGTMGAGIAQVSAAAGFPTLLFDVKPEAVSAGMDMIRKNLGKAVEKGKLKPADRDATLLRLTPCHNIADCRADLIFEAIVEKVPVKVSLFRELAQHNPPTTIFASNTSSLSVSAIAAEIPHPERVAGMHFFNPAQLMALVEIVSAAQTDPAIAQLLYQLVQHMGKTPVQVKDAPGFIVNRVARHYYLEAMEIAQSGAADLQTIDRLLEAAGFRMGPFALMDLIGNDVNFAVTKSLYEAFHEAPRFKPGALQAALVEKGELGRKTGQGFYKY